jgi:(4-(4-[2-(gamma-L-glutamylamino)ethyl]phenoxymethyl)furan-2-yl)methanamine synthase
MRSVIGWDVGGAHLKAARAENGRIVDAIQLASPLRLGLDRLAQAFAEAKARMGAAQLHAVTMTGELADTFSSRAEGVEKLTALAVRELAPAEVALYGGRAGFIAPRDAPRHVEDIASANWFASAALAARVQRTALLVDIGSTTTDLVPVVDGAVAARGYTDAERLAAGELVYTGLVRSFVMAVGERAPFAGRWSPLINENFATMADVYRILGQLPDGADRQTRAIVDGAMLVLSSARVPADAPLLGAGIGEALAQEVARRLERRHVSFGSILDVAPAAREQASHCAPAAALAALASMSGRGAVETESGRAVG